MRVPFDPREVLARVVDGSEFSEYKTRYGTSLVTGWATVHGYPVGVLANERGVLFSEEAKKASEFILLANQSDTPLVFLQNTTGYMVGAAYEQGGIIKDGAKMINAVTNSAVPHITSTWARRSARATTGCPAGPSIRGSCSPGRTPSSPSWAPSSSRACCRSWPGRPRRRAAPSSTPAEDDQRRAAIEDQIERESHAFFVTARLYDDGVIDPRDTRTVLGMALSAAHSGPVQGSRGFGVFRM